MNGRNTVLRPGDGLDPSRSVHNTRNDHCICGLCWGECYQTVPMENGRTFTFTCPQCHGTGKGLCRHRGDELSNRERKTSG